jgi:catechol 2,3-dioxygenase-like lactoylglutathione lyase family enzyme
MPISYLEHVNVRTSHLDEMVKFYDGILGFKLGSRPPFKFGGAWMWLGDRPVVHIVEVEHQPKVGEPQIEHFAFRAQGLAEFVGHLQRKQWEHRVVPVPGNGNAQVVLRDPDGNRIEIQFDASEANQIDAALYTSREDPYVVGLMGKRTS